MTLYNFTNRKQGKHQEFFEEKGFSEVTRPLHPYTYSYMDEKFIEELVRKTIFQDIITPNTDKDAIHILVAGENNVCHYVLKYCEYWNSWKFNRGLQIHAYYITTAKIRDGKDRFVFEPVDLREYHTEKVTEIY